MTTNQALPKLNPENYNAVLFDLDGVITRTAKIHGECWKTMFDEFLSRRAQEAGQAFRPFDITNDYRLYVDGKPRYEGVASFLQSRSIELPQGDTSDSPDRQTVCGLGNRKDQLVKEAIKRGKVEVFENSITLIRQLRDKGVRIAVVSSSRNCKEILDAVGILDLFEVRVDGVVADELGLKGKPQPDTFLKAAEMLQVEPERAVVVEDAIVGVQAGKNGKFGLVIGVDRTGHPEALRENGADVVVQDLGEFLPNA